MEQLELTESMDPPSKWCHSVVHQEQVIVCEYCNTVNEIPALEPGQRVRCSTCDNILQSYHPQLITRLLAFSAAALVMLLMVCSFPLLGISSNGVEKQMNFVDMVTVLLGHHFVIFGALVVLLLFVFPISYLVSLFYLSIGWQWRKKLVGQQLLTHWCCVCHPWLMVDVFLVGLLVSLVKLHSMAHIHLGLSFWAYVIFVICFVRLMSLIDRRVLWQLTVPDFKLRTMDDLAEGAVSCSFCEATVEASHTHCPRCHHRLEKQKKHSLRTTIAFLIAAMLMYIPANVLPIMMTEFLGQESYSTILGGVLMLWGMGSYPVAMVIFIASVVVPIAKILALFWLCWQVRYGADKSDLQKQRLYQITEFVGRWSMIDIFVVAILTALVQMGNLMRVLPGSAVLSFASVVILTMLAARSFDSRLLWSDETPKSPSNEELSV